MHEKEVILRISRDRIAPTDATKPVVLEPEGVAIDPHIFPTKGVHPLRPILAAQVVEVVVPTTHRKRRFDLGKPVQGVVNLPVNLGTQIPQVQNVPGKANQVEARCGSEEPVEPGGMRVQVGYVE